jgi:tetratricopeptide (TPR) repeat protein
MTIWGGAGRERSVTLKQPALRIAGGAAAVLVATVIAVLAVAHPLVADSQYLVASQAWDNGDTTRARQAVADARTLAPDESAYAILAGDLALDLDNNGVPAADANWQAARQQYEDALRLGTFSPEPFRELARTYRALGLRGQAIATAKRAVLLNRFDPANEAVLVEVSK